MQPAHLAYASTARNDAMVGLEDVGHFHQRYREEYERAVRNRQALCIIILAVDGFSETVARVGTTVGDQLLEATAGAILSVTQGTDAATCTGGGIAAQTNGEKFVLLLPGMGRKARTIAEKVRRTASDSVILLATGERVRISVSVGVACTAPWAGLDPDALLTVAARALTTAQQEGGNRVAAAWEI